jgi:peptidoglycan hydrolase FlgJ
MTSGSYPATSSAAALEINPSWQQRPVPRAQATKNEAEAQRVGREFEQMFLSQMLQPMFDNIGEGPFGGGYGEKMFKSMQVDEYAKALSRTGTFGIADAVAREMLRMQEKANG